MMTTTENAIEQVGTLRIERSEIDSGVAFVKIWRGKAERPYANYRFRNVAAREAYIAEQVEAAERAAAWKEERKAARAAKTAEMCELIRVGCILHYSWGYEQTQCEFYQVIAKAGRKVTIRRIASKTVEGSEGFDSDRRQPVRDAFLENAEPMTKLIQDFGLKMDHGGAYLCNDTDSFYCSWYH